MNKKTIKLITSLVLLLVITFTMVNSVFAAFPEITIDGSTGMNSNLGQRTNNIMGTVLGVVQVVAMGVAIIMLTVLGIKYVAASPNEKAEYKKGMTVYIIGAVLLFGAGLLVGLIKTWTTDILQ